MIRRGAGKPANSADQLAHDRERRTTDHPKAPRGSAASLLAGALLIMVALVCAVYGFLSLIRVLDGGGYGTPAMRWVLVVLGTAGALLAAGICTIIWDIAKRHEAS